MKRNWFIFCWKKFLILKNTWEKTVFFHTQFRYTFFGHTMSKHCKIITHDVIFQKPKKNLISDFLSHIYKILQLKSFRSCPYRKKLMQKFPVFQAKIVYLVFASQIQCGDSSLASSCSGCSVSFYGLPPYYTLLLLEQSYTQTSFFPFRFLRCFLQLSEQRQTDWTKVHRKTLVVAMIDAWRRTPLSLIQAGLLLSWLNFVSLLWL